MKLSKLIPALAIVLSAGCTSEPVVVREPAIPTTAASSAVSVAQPASRIPLAPPADAAQAPSFQLPLVTGGNFDIEQTWNEKPVVLVFFESWCELCKDQQPVMNQMAADFGDQVQVIGVAGISKEEETAAYIADQGVDYPVGSDPSGKIWQKYGVTEAPLVAVVGVGGKLLAGFPGIDDDIISSVESRLFQ